MMALPRAACISSATNRSNISAGDMRHFRANIDCPRGVREATHRNIIHPGGRNAVDVFESDAAACFEFDIVCFERNGLPNLSRCHVVEQDYVYSLNCDEGANFFQIIGFHFDTDALSLLAKLLDSVSKTGESIKGRQMVVLHAHHSVYTKTVILPATS